jgi:Ser/Thr protein kinase RdoA (MazF antagonist)
MTDFYQLDAEEQAQRLSTLAELALSHWGVSDCTPRLIKYRENAVFEVRDRDGARAVLRVHRQGYHSDDSLESELRWMAMLREGGMAVPSPIAPVQDASGSGYMVSVQTDQTPGDWQVDMLSWMPGRELGEVGVPLALDGRDVASLFESIGQCMARLHNLSTAWPQAATMQRHAWDGPGLVGSDPLWGRFWELQGLDAEQRKLILTIKDAVAADLANYGQSCDNYGLIHADLVPENVMLHERQVQLIDFDDAGFGWHMFEIATALHWLVEEPQFELMQASMLAGYQRERPLSTRDLDTLELFFVARSLTYLGWVHARSQTETAVEMTPVVIEIATALGEQYLAGRSA